MWDSVRDLQALSLLLAFALDFTVGKPRWMPDLARSLRAFAGVWERRLSVSPALTWLVALLGCVLVLLLLTEFLLKQSQLLVLLIETFVLYQALSAADFSRRLKGIHTHLRKNRIDDARQGALRMGLSQEPATTKEELASQLLAETGESVAPRLVAPLFWSVLLGPVGALVYNMNQAFVVGFPTNTGEKQVIPWPDRIHHLLLWVPARTIPLLSEVFRNFQSLKTIFREGQQIRGNDGFGAAALARELEVQLILHRPHLPSMGHPLGEGDAPQASDLSEALNWHFKLTAFALILALFAFF
ncbi:MAG: cobalamin biosynthesis protein [Verrucomicrobiota bacterium]